MIKRFQETRLRLLGLVVGLALFFAGAAAPQTKKTEPTPAPKAAASSVTQQKAAPTAAKPTKAKGAAGTVHTVTITPGKSWDEKPSVDRLSVTLSKDDEVKWVCSTGCDFSINFAEPTRKPFKGRAFGKVRNRSGRPAVHPTMDETYKYSVIVGGGILDPDVIIRGGGG